MSHIKNLRYTVGTSGFLSLGLYLTFAVFGWFSVSEPVLRDDSMNVCSALIYIGFVIMAFWNNNNLISSKATDEKEVASWGIVFYLLFLAVEFLSFGAPVRGLLHAVLPATAILIPSVISLITKEN